MSKTLPISEVKTRLPELVSGVEEREEEIVVTRKGKPAGRSSVPAQDQPQIPRPNPALIEPQCSLDN